MKITLFPQDTLGKWASGLGIAFILLISMKIKPGIPIPTFGIAALGLAGFIAGITAIIKNKDRSLLTLLSILAGLIIIIWIAAEFISPH